jgi:hypothetical protein
MPAEPQQLLLGASDNPTSPATPRGLPRFAATASFVAAVATLAEFIATIAFGNAITSWALVALVSVPILALLSVVWYLLRQFEVHLKHLESTALGMQQAISSAWTTHRLYVQVADAAHDIAIEVNERGPGRMSERDLAFCLKHACRAMARAFTESTSAACRVCVKQVFETPTARRNNAPVKTICRNIGPAGDLPGHPNRIRDNTDFFLLLNGYTDYWLCQDIATVPDYHNPHPNPGYRSVIVWPIATNAKLTDGNRQATGQPEEETNTAGHDQDDDGGPVQPIVAFLCLDAEVVDLFNELLHVPIGWTMADAMARAYEAHYLTFDEKPHLGSTG